MPEKELLLLVLAVEVSPQKVAISWRGCVLCSLHCPLPLSMGHVEGFLFFGTFPFFGIPRMYVSYMLVFSLPPVLHLLSFPP